MTVNKLEDNAVILARVSSKAQEDEGYSLDSQEKLLLGYCENKQLKSLKSLKLLKPHLKNKAGKSFMNF